MVGPRLIRPITISNVFDIILESYIFDYLDSNIANHDLQFGFSANASCAHAFFLFKEACYYNIKHNLKSYVVFLDFKAAFDRVMKYKLLLVLLNMSINPLFWLVLFLYGDASKIIIKANMRWSKIMKILRSVKQGGRMSPKLFAIYIDKLIKMLAATGLVIIMA